MMAARMETTKYSGIYKRGSRYVVKWRHNGRQHKQSFGTLQEAREAKGRRQAGETRPPNRELFSTYAMKWLDTYQGRTSRALSDSTREGYRRSIERWAIPYLGTKRIDAIGPRDIRGFVLWMQSKNVGPASIAAHMTPLKALLACAYEDGDIRSNPSAQVRVPRVEQEGEAKAKAMTREELAMFMSACPDGWKPFFTFLAQTGLRISEALAVTWDDLDLGTNPKVRVHRQFYRGKLTRLKTTYSRREVPLSPNMATTLRALRAEQYAADRPVFASITGTHMSAPNIRTRVVDPIVRGRVIKRRRTRDTVIPPLVPGLEWVSFHTFRHTCASLLFAGGKDVKQVSRWLGHAKASFTLDTYVHLVDEGVGEADFLDRVVCPVVSTAARQNCRRA